MRTLNIKSIRTDRREEYSKIVERILKLSKRFGIPAPKFTESAPYDIIYRYSPPDSKDVAFVDNVFDVSIDVSDSLKFKGWNLYATVDYSTGTAVMVSVDDKMPDGLGLAYHECDHCHTERRRNIAYVLRSDEGKFIQVGSSCVEQFLGISPTALMSYLQSFSPFTEIPMTEIGDDEESIYGGRGKRSDSMVAVPLDVVLTLANEVVLNDGEYVKVEYYEEPRRRSNEGLATADKVKAMIDEGVTRVNEPVVADIKKALNEIEITPVKTVRDFSYSYVDGRNGKYITSESAMTDTQYGIMRFEVIRDAKAHLTQFFTSTNSEFSFGEEYDRPIYSAYNDYIVKLKNLIQQTNIRKFEIGLASSIIKWYYKHLEDRHKPVSKAVGNVGDRIPLELILKDILTTEGAFGTVKIWKFEDAGGNKFVKFGQINDRFIIRKPEDGGLDGTVYRFNAEIKGHKEFNGAIETTIGRVSKYEQPKS